MTVENLIKVTFSEMAHEGMLPGIRPVFDGTIDLEVTEPAAKVLVLSHLGYEDASAKYNYAYPHSFRVWGYPEIEFEGASYPFKFPFLAQTVQDHWNEHKQEMPGKVLVRFLHTDWQMATSYKNRARQEIIQKGYDPEQVIFVPILEFEEVIGEFVSLFYFRNQGYITTVGVPHTGVKIPDVTCWKTPLLRKLRESGLVENGATLMELTMLRAFGKIKSAKKDISDNFDESVVIEVEPSRTRAYGGVQQLLGQTIALGAHKDGYVEGGNYDKGFIVAPDYTDEYYKIGILSFTEDGLHFRDCPVNYSKPEPKAMSMKEMDSVFRMALLSNLTFDEIVGLLPDVKGKTFHQVMSLMSQIDADRIITEIKKQVGENAG